MDEKVKNLMNEMAEMNRVLQRGKSRGEKESLDRAQTGNFNGGSSPLRKLEKPVSQSQFANDLPRAEANNVGDFDNEYSRVSLDQEAKNSFMECLERANTESKLANRCIVTETTVDAKRSRLNFEQSSSSEMSFC